MILLLGVPVCLTLSIWLVRALCPSSRVVR
jgi:hypothetical protein